jgi:pimeloyl-ACP methyl ester carboxylesterase
VRLPFLEQLLKPYSLLWRKSTYANKIKNSVQHPDRLPPDWLDRAATQASKLKREALLGTTHLVRNLDLSEEISAIEVPVLLLHGDNDKSVKLAEAHRLRDAFADARLHVVPDCGHCPNYEYPELVDELILEFLSER